MPCGVAGGDLLRQVLPLSTQQLDLRCLLRCVAALLLQLLFQRRQFARLLLPPLEQPLLTGGQRRSLVSDLRQTPLTLGVEILLRLVPRRLQLIGRQSLSAARTAFVCRHTQHGGLHRVPEPAFFCQLFGQFRRFRRQFIQPRLAVCAPLRQLPAIFLSIFQLQQAGRQLLQPQLRSGRQRLSAQFLQPGFRLRQRIARLLFLLCQLPRRKRRRLRQTAARLVQPHRNCL